jgi:hypothetical protein
MLYDIMLVIVALFYLIISIVIGFTILCAIEELLIKIGLIKKV